MSIINLPPSAFNTLPPTMLEDDGFDATWATVPHTVGPIRTTPRRSVPSAFVASTPPNNPIFQFKIPENSPGLQPVARQVADLDPYEGVGKPELLALTALSGIWSFVSEVSGLVVKSVQYVREKIEAWNREQNPASDREARRFDPMTRAGRSKRRQEREGSDEAMIGQQSMLALPPHMVGATPKVVRQDRQKHEKKPQLPISPPDSPDATKLHDWNLFHATPHPSHRADPEPRRATANAKRVRFADTNGNDEDETAHAPVTPLRRRGVLKHTGTPTTPMFVFNTPDNTRKAMNKKEEFDMNIKKGCFNTWLKFLHEQGLSVRNFHKDLKEFTLPTEIILKVWNEKDKHPEKWEIFTKCWTHQGFLKRLGITIPTVEFTEPRDWDKEKLDHTKKINFESPVQQKDGCCKHCRGYPWAGKVETREVTPKGDVEVHSWHKSQKPYTKEESRDFEKFKYDLLYTRWCRESRYDWIFEEPKELEGKEWEIPHDDPRLRHVTRMKLLTKFLDADIMDHRAAIIKQYSQQDLAAKRFIDAIEKHDKAIGARLRKMDLERKRRQVRTEYLCVKQIKVVTSISDEIPEPEKPEEALNEPHKRHHETVEGGGKKRRTGVDTSKAPTPAGKKTLPSKKRQPLTKKKNTNTKKSHRNTTSDPTLFDTALSAPAFDPQQLKSWKPPAYVLQEQPWADGWSAAYEESIKKVPRQWRNKGTGCFSAWEEDLPAMTREELEAVGRWENGNKEREERDREEMWRRMEREEEERWKKGREDRAGKIAKRNGVKKATVSFAGF